MLLTKLLSMLQNSNTSLLFWNLFTGLMFMSELNIKSFLSLTKFSLSLSHHISMTLTYSASSWSQHTLFTLCFSDQNVIITEIQSPILPTCFISSLEPASYHSGFLIQITHPLSATFIWTCRCNLLHTAITLDHFFTVSLWAQNLPFLENLILHLIVGSELPVRRTDLMALDRSPNLFAHRFYVLVLFFCISYS